MGIGLVAGVDDTARFHKEDVNFILGKGLVLHSFGDDEEFAGVEVHGTLVEIDAEMAFKDQESLVGVFVMMPDEVTVELD